MSLFVSAISLSLHHSIAVTQRYNSFCTPWRIIQPHTPTYTLLFPPTPPKLTHHNYRPKCPQPSLPTRLEDPLIGVTSAKAQHATDTFSEFECLNLNIIAPAGQRFGSDLPVMVYIHGGGGYSGANSDWWCDGGSLVKRSLNEGKGVIHVALK